MCSYDDMSVQLSQQATEQLLRTETNARQKVPQIKRNIYTIFGLLRVWFFVLLLLQPVYGSPLRRLIENQRHIRHPHRSVSRKSSDSTTVQSSSSTIVPTRKPHPTMDDADRAVGRSRRASAGCDGGPSGDSSSVGGSWQEPCRNLNLVKEGSATTSELSLHITKGIVEANSQVESFIDSFSEDAFGVVWKDATEHHDYNLDFLNTSSGVDLADLSKVSFEDALREAYELMQRRAVGIEQVTLDQALYQSGCLSRFRQLERHIIHILCQLRHAMISKSVVPRDNVTKDIMLEMTRSLESEHSRNIRDAIILREYIASLHLLHSVFNHFHQQ